MASPKTAPKQSNSGTRITILIAILLIGGLAIAYWASARLKEETQDITYFAVGNARTQKMCADDLAAAEVYPDREILTIGHKFLVFEDHAGPDGKPMAKPDDDAAEGPQILCEVDGASNLKQAWIEMPEDRASHELATVAQGYDGIAPDIILVFQPKTTAAKSGKARAAISR